MLKCKDVQDIVAEEEKLSFSQKTSLKFHLFICKKCRQVKTQYYLIKARVKGIEIPLDEKDHCQIDLIIQSATEKNK